MSTNIAGCLIILIRCTRSKIERVEVIVHAKTGGQGTDLVDPSLLIIDIIESSPSGKFE